MQIPDTKLIKYLLGSLDETGEREISLRLIEDKTFENELLYAESELIEAFLEKSLSPEDERLFHANFLINEERADRLREIYVLKKYAASEIKRERSEKIQKRSAAGFWESLRALFPANLNPVSALLTMLIVALLIGAVWRVFFTDNPVEMTQLEKQYAEINRGDLNNQPQLTSSPIVLIPITVRGADENGKIDSRQSGDKLFFRLGLPFEIADREFLKAELTKDQKTIFTQNEVRIYKNPNGQEVKLILPKSVMQKGKYQIRLENPNNGNSPFNYTFVVE